MFYIHLEETERHAFWFYKRQNNRSSINKHHEQPCVRAWLWFRRALPYWALGITPGERCQAAHTSSVSKPEEVTWKRNGTISRKWEHLRKWQQYVRLVCTCLFSSGCWIALKSILTPSYFASSPIHFPTRSEKQRTSVRDYMIKLNDMLINPYLNHINICRNLCFLLPFKCWLS